MFYGQRIHDKCYRRGHFDAGQFAEKFDDQGAKLGYCLYKVGCKGPTTYAPCSTIQWNEGLSWPVKSGHGCIGCAEPNFFDKGSFYEHETTVLPPIFAGVEGTVDKVGLATVAVVALQLQRMLRSRRLLRRAPRPIRKSEVRNNERTQNRSRPGHPH